MRPFGPEHLVALAWTLPLVVASCWLGRRWLSRAARGSDPHGVRKERLLSVWWGTGVVGINIASIVYWLMPARFDLKVSLPLQLCDLACAMTPLVFLTGWRLPRALVYFWGIGLSTQAFVTPTLDEPPPSARYWLFWLVHLAIVGSAVYDLVVRRFRPTWRELLWAIGVSVAWVLLMVWLNEALGSNYGYVGRGDPGSPTIVDFLGPWPARVLVMAAIGIAAFVCLWGVWPLWARLRPGHLAPRAR